MTTKISGDNISAIANTGVTWNAVTVADGSTQLNASAGNGYFLDTNAGVIEVFLPSSPTRGDTVILADYGNNFATNRVIVNTGGKLIDSVVGGDPGTSGFKIDTDGAVVELIFADDTAGWIVKQNNVPSDLGNDNYLKYVTATGGTVTTSGDYKIHTFTGDGCFVVSCAGNEAGSNKVSYLVVAGGGGGAGNPGSSDGSSGGGAGGFREGKCSSDPYTASPLAATPCSALPVTSTTYPITVGGGGTAGPASLYGGKGNNSVFSTITSTGGGGGQYPAPPYAPPTAKDGGSGAGAAASGNPLANQIGLGNTPPTSPSQGNNGGNYSSSGASAAGGGGGAGAVGSNAPGPTVAGDGGAGATSSITGSAVQRGGGGGGSSYPVGTGGDGGSGGGGAGGLSPTNPTPVGISGSTNTGGGGGAANANPGNPGSGGAGGSGIVIIRYKFQ